MGGGISLSPLVVVLEDTKSQVLQIAAGPYHTLVTWPKKFEVKGGFYDEKCWFMNALLKCFLIANLQLRF